MPRRLPPTAYGLWGWPAGLVHEGEPLEAAAVREAKEETNLDVRIDGRVAIYQARTEDFVKHLFVGTVVGGELCADRTEILSAAWLSLAEIQCLAEEAQLRGRWVVDGVRDYLGRHSREDGAKPTPAGS